MPYLQNQFERNFLTTSVDYVFNWGAEVSHLAPHLWAGLLRDRDDRLLDLAF